MVYGGRKERERENTYWFVNDLLLNALYCGRLVLAESLTSEQNDTMRIEKWHENSCMFRDVLIVRGLMPST